MFIVQQWQSYFLRTRRKSSSHASSPRTRRFWKRSNMWFLPEKSLFKRSVQRDIHMKNTHKKCNCGCEMYFETRAHYLAHFYTVYPLACFENRKCPHRFQSVLYQAEHHATVHNSEHPYYCVPCSARDEDGLARRLAKTCAFKDEKALRRHGSLMYHSEAEMYFIEETSFKPSAKSSAINYC